MVRVISISDEAYVELKKLKGDTSFSKTILSLTENKRDKSIMKFAGIWDNEEALKIKKELGIERKKLSRRML